MKPTLNSLLEFLPESAAHFPPFSLAGVQEDSICVTEGSFELTQSPLWEKLIFATYLADLISYPNPTDQVTLPRLMTAMNEFPQGFKLWWLKQPDGRWWPAGYSGWHPMSEAQFLSFENTPELTRDLNVLPRVEPTETAPYLYIFNYSVAPSLRKSLISRQLMIHFATDLSKANSKGLACISVSEDGNRMASRLGLKISGHFKLDGQIETIFIKRN